MVFTSVSDLLTHTRTSTSESRSLDVQFALRNLQLFEKLAIELSPSFNVYYKKKRLTCSAKFICNHIKLQLRVKLDVLLQATLQC